MSFHFLIIQIAAVEGRRESGEAVLIVYNNTASYSTSVDENSYEISVALLEISLLLLQGTQNERHYNRHPLKECIAQHARAVTPLSK